jgi:hypothetical protein
MTGNERIVHPVPRIFLLALLGIAAAVILTVAQVSVLRAFMYPSSNLSSSATPVPEEESSYSDTAMLEPSALIELTMTMPLGTRLILLTFNMGLICTLLFLMTLWSPRILRRFLFGRGFGGSSASGKHSSRTSSSHGTHPHIIVEQPHFRGRQPAYSTVLINHRSTRSRR